MKAAMQHGAYKKAVYLRLFERKLIDRAAGLHFTSALEREESSQLGFQSRSFVVPNASVMLKDVGTTRGAFRREFGIPPDGALTIVVGRNHYLKRLELALQAFRLLSRDNRNAHLAFIGPACDSPAMSRQIFDLGLTGRVHLCGLVSAEKLAEVYTDADLLAMLSLRENFGNVVIEAAARGVPALLSKHVGLAEEITAAGAGVIVEDDPHQIAESWNRMLVCNSRACMSAAARKFAEAFTPERIASNMVREFTTATGAKDN
jgi:glycosyltransferase involved in cell wall biosynthesis